MKTVRSMLIEYQKEILGLNMTPNRAADVLIELASLYSTVSEQLKNAQMLYNKVFLEISDQEPKAVKAKIRAESTSEYEVLLSVKSVEKSISEMMKSLKYYIRVSMEEQRSQQSSLSR